jgi:hypothetical protein
LTNIDRVRSTGYGDDVDPTPEDHVRLAIEALIEQRGQLDLKIRSLQMVLEEMQGDVTYVDLTPIVPKTPSISEVVMNLLAIRGTVSVDEIMQGLRLAGNGAQRDSVASTLSRMVANGQIARGPYRGSYARTGTAAVQRPGAPG